MTTLEFHEWLDHHTSFYPSVKTWLEKQGQHSEKVIDAWKSIMCGVDLRDACRASELLYSEETQPKSFDRHPKVVRSIISREAEKRIRGKTHVRVTYRCQHCHDEGYVTVFIGSTELMDQYSEKYGPDCHTMHASIPCGCEIGMTKEVTLRFDPARHVKKNGPYKMLPEELRREIESGSRCHHNPFVTAPTMEEF